MSNLTLGSLFSGSGGFELAGQLAGIKPVWNCEVEPFAVAVTRKNFPDVKHYGDINALNGAELEPVDIITWGSPCQDLSIAGKRAGLSGSRSGLYVEAVRIVKEMLEATDGKYPKFCVFENVPGLLSSNDGADFYVCLDMMQELGFLPDANILDTQFMGVPQRRKRVYITWVQVDYILQKRTPISDSITLQLLTEILQMNLAGLLGAYGIELKKSAANVRNQSGDGVKRRMNLFSLQREDRLRMLQMRLDEMQVTHLKEQSGLDSNLGDDLMAAITSTTGGTKSECLTTGNQSWSIGQSLKSALEDGLQIENGSITSIWTRETIVQKICTCFQALLNTLDVTMNLMHSLEKEPMSLNCFEWVKYSLTEVKEFTNAARKYEKSTGRLVGDDLLRIYEQRVRNAGDWIEQNFADRCGREILPQPESLPWNSQESISQRQRAAGSSSACFGTPSLCLNDQGGARMDVSEDVTSTLRAEDHGHPPCVVGSAGFCTEHSANSRSIGYEEEKSPTLRAGVVPAAVTMWENHSQDTRYTGPLDTAPTVSSTYGTGGNNQPFVVGDTPKTMKIRSGCEGGGKGILVQEDKSATLACANDQTVFAPKAYGISSFCSNAMLSDNPHAGIYEAETSRTLDCSGGSPTANQGGVCVVEQEKCYDIRQTSDGTKVSRHHCYETDTARSLSTNFPDPTGNHGGVAVVGQEWEDEPVAFTQNQRDEVRDLGDKSGSLQAQPGMKQQTYVLQGNMIGRSDKNGPQGSGVSEDVCYTLTDVDRHAVVAPDANCTPDDSVYAMTTGSFMEVSKEKAPTLMARDYKDPTTVAPMPSGEPLYTARRLTPTECARLQGFPDRWAKDLGNPDPSDEELAFWMDVWETHRQVVTHASKPKTEKQIRKWLADPHTDSAEYKLWGNGIALPCAHFVLEGIAACADDLL